VVDLDDNQTPRQVVTEPQARPQSPLAPPPTPLATKEKALAGMLARGYKEDHPDVKRLKLEIQQQAKDAKASAPAHAPVSDPKSASATEVASDSHPQAPLAPPPPAPRKAVAAPARYVNPILEAQVVSADAEIAKHKDQMQVLSKEIAAYQAKLEAIPVREQEIAQLVRDYEISKAHYGQMLNNQLSAATATQLEVRQQGEKFSVLDPAQPAQTPTRPRRKLLYAGGSLGGLGLGLLLALATEFLGMSISSAEHLTAATGLQVLEVIPLIETRADRVARRKRVFVATVSSVAAALVVGAILAYEYRARFF
jgi:hypothetical protein